MATAPLSAIIVDDEALARRELAYLLEKAGGVNVVAEATNGIEAVKTVREHAPDVVFMDVQMPGLDGFGVLKRLMDTPRLRMPEVVFATAFDQYAVRAFEVNAIAYLLKPFDQKRVNAAVERARYRRDGSASGEVAVAQVTQAPSEERLEALLKLLEVQATAAPREAAPAPRRSGKIVVRSAQRLLLVDEREVVFASIEGGAISVVAAGGEGDSNVRTLEELAEQLDPEMFWRVHRSFLVNIQHIREVVPWFRSSYLLRMDDKKATEIPVARAQTKRLREMFNL